MKRGGSGSSFRSALLVSLLIHGGLLVMLVGLGGVLAPEQPEIKLEWVWSAPQSPPRPAAALPAAATPSAPSPTTQPAPAPAGPVAATSATTANPATVAASPTTPPSTAPASTATPAAPAQPPAATGPSADLPSGSGYALVPPRLRERPALAIPPALASASGEVLLQVEVLADGRVGASRVIRSSGRRDLDEMARQYVAGWIFQPAWQPQANKPVRVLTSVWVNFGTKKE